MKIICISLIFSLLFTTVALAEEPDTHHAAGIQASTSAAAREPAPDPFEQAMTAKSVAEFARRRKNVQAMIVAARMLLEVRFSDQAGPNDPKLSQAAFTPEALFNEAEAMAKDDPQVLAQIRIARSSGRGVLSSVFGKGLVRVVKDVGARATYAFQVQAKPGELLRIGAIGDTTIRMAMRLLDPRGKLLCSEGGDYAPVCSFKPLMASALTVELQNQGDASTRAVILSN